MSVLLPANSGNITENMIQFYLYFENVEANNCDKKNFKRERNVQYCGRISFSNT